MAAADEWRQEPLTLKMELHIQSVGLHHHAPVDFFRSQWQKEEKSMWFLVYRWLLAAFFGSGVISYVSIYYSKGYVFIYLTNWGFILCAISSLTAALCVTFHHLNSQQMTRQGCLIKCYWVCYWINLILSNVISVIYWAFMHFDGRRVRMRASPLYNYWTHAVPPILFTLDHMLVAHPSRIWHFVYPLIFTLCYAAFTIIYYLLGGLNPFGGPCIYHILNYSQPGRVLASFGWITVVLLVCSTLQYGVYRLRVFIARKLGKLQ